MIDRADAVNLAYDLIGKDRPITSKGRQCLADAVLRMDAEISLNAGPKAPPDLSREVREIADAIDRGEVTALVAALVRGSEFSFVHGASIRDCLELATLLQARCIERYRE